MQAQIELIGRYEAEICCATDGSVDAFDVNVLVSAQNFARGWLEAMQQLQTEDLQALSALTAARFVSVKRKKRKLVHFEDENCSLMDSMSLHGGGDEDDR